MFVCVAEREDCVRGSKCNKVYCKAVCMYVSLNLISEWKDTVNPEYNQQLYSSTCERRLTHQPYLRGSILPPPLH